MRKAVLPNGEDLWAYPPPKLIGVPYQPWALEKFRSHHTMSGPDATFASRDATLEVTDGSDPALSEDTEDVRKQWHVGLARRRDTALLQRRGPAAAMIRLVLPRTFERCGPSGLAGRARGRRRRRRGYWVSPGPRRWKAAYRFSWAARSSARSAGGTCAGRAVGRGVGRDGRWRWSSRIP